MSSPPNDVSRCAGVCCEVRESCRRYMDRDQRHGVLWWTDYSLLGEQVMRIEQCESGVAIGGQGE